MAAYEVKDECVPPLMSFTANDIPNVPSFSDYTNVLDPLNLNDIKTTLNQTKHDVLGMVDQLASEMISGRYRRIFGFPVAASRLTLTCTLQASRMCMTTCRRHG